MRSSGLQGAQCSNESLPNLLHGEEETPDPDRTANTHALARQLAVSPTEDKRQEASFHHHQSSSSKTRSGEREDIPPNHPRFSTRGSRRKFFGFGAPPRVTLACIRITLQHNKAQALKPAFVVQKICKLCFPAEQSPKRESTNFCWSPLMLGESFLRGGSRTRKQKPGGAARAGQFRHSPLSWNPLFPSRGMWVVQMRGTAWKRSYQDCPTDNQRERMGRIADRTAS
ncbi:uncharacterized protein B0T15DRAFT_180485 [Chaetomium strumarium]|uniref:Uncharacterized protein n=1 Tax=Chaetomium strumarium TaxID=1170767 RepID=A0AAJ0GWL1_9PEZI|nr:hypothetical protein B0T15DRAFT_180485 [Chaetomium strumarium]